MGVKIVCRNKKAYHDYAIEAKLEAGMVLSGPEVKSLRAGKANLKDGYVQINEQGEAILHNVDISQYSHATHNPNDPLRVRKLLLHKRELKKLIGKLQEKGLALIPLSIYFNDKGKAKVELGLARGKSDREVERAMRRDRDS